MEFDNLLIIFYKLDLERNPEGKNGGKRDLRILAMPFFL